jgi:putative sterol carrier protein
MKKKILTTALVLMAAITMHAQSINDQPVFQKHARRQHTKMILAKQLQFTEDQKQSLKNIQSGYKIKLAALNKQPDITVAAYREKLKTIHREKSAQINAMLSPEQKATLQQLKEKRKAIAKINAKVRVEKLQVQLGLSSSQAAQLKEIRNNTFAQLKALRSDSSLGAEEKRTAFKSLMANQKQQSSAVLTPEQLQTWKEMRQQHNRREFSK